MAEQLVSLKSPNDALKFLSMEGSEELSRPFDYSVVAVAKPTDKVEFDKLLGHPAQVTVAVDGKPKRYYHGLITAVSYEGHVGANRAYRLSLRPWLWLATRASDVRIFQKISVPDILKKVFTAYGGQSEFKLKRTYRKREYCTQYRETDFNFVSRLMEEEGIFYFFVHDNGKHTLVLADESSAHVNMLGLSRIPFRDIADTDESVNRWRWSAQIQTTSVTLRDRSFQRPAATLEKKSEVARTHAQNQLKVYDAPAGIAPYPDDPGLVGGLDDESAALAKLRIEELQARYALVDGDTNSVNLCAGARFQLVDHAVGGQDGEYVVMSTRIQMRMPGYEAGATQSVEHHCQFVAFGAQTPFRPARLTPKPTVAGPQTATVSGPSGEEIFVDKYGRVKLQFHWDREGKSDENSSCFVRVSQPSAGKGWGMVFLPRIGQEVVVDFIEGDPDQPLITGRVYNAEQMPPYTLPDHKAVSTIKSRSTAKGGAANFNEIRFDDTKGSELLLLHAEKDRIDLIENDAKTDIGNDQTVTVGKDRIEKIQGENHLVVAKDVTHKFDGKLNQKIAQDVLLATDGLHSLKAAKDITAEAGTAYSVKAGTDLHVKAGKNAGLDAGMNAHLKGGMNVVIEAGMQLTLKAGAGSIVIGPDGVSITGPLVKINSGGGPGSGAGASPVAPTAPGAAKDAEAPEDPLPHN